MTMSLSEAYLAMQEASGIKIGDTVRVLRKAADWEMGWCDGWADDKMDSYIGREWQVIDIFGDSGVLLEGGWRFPFFVLEKIKDAPRFIEINGHKVPEPVGEPLKRGEKYWAVMTDYTNLYLEYTWQGDKFDRCFLERGIIHKTREAAEIHAKALLSFTSKED